MRIYYCLGCDKYYIGEICTCGDHGEPVKPEDVIGMLNGPRLSDIIEDFTAENLGGKSMKR